MAEILVVAHSSFRSVGRVVYRELYKNGYDITIIHPRELVLANGKSVSADSKSANDPPLIALEQVRSHPRINTYAGLSKCLDEIHPKIIVLENDPICLLSYQLGKWAGNNNAYLVCLTNDNLSRKFASAYSRGGIKLACYCLMLQGFNYLLRKNVHHVFTISDDGLKLYDELGYKGKLQKTPLGFDPNIFYKSDERREKLRNELGLKYNVIAYFGRVQRQKGIHILIDALGKIKDLNWHFMIDKFEEDSRDNYMNSLKNLIESNNIADRIIYVEASHEEIADYMRAADIVVAPSLTPPDYKEQYGRVVPEAMACGCALLVSNSGALPELLGDAGVVLENNTSAELSVQLRSLLTNEEQCKDFSDKATVRARQFYSMEVQVAVFEEMLNGFGVRKNIAE